MENFVFNHPEFYQYITNLPFFHAVGICFMFIFGIAGFSSYLNMKGCNETVNIFCSVALFVLFCYTFSIPSSISAKSPLMAGSCYERDISATIPKKLESINIQLSSHTAYYNEYDNLLQNLEKVESQMTSNEFMEKRDKIKKQLSDYSSQIKENREEYDRVKNMNKYTYVILENKKEDNVYFNSNTKEIGQNLTVFTLFNNSMAKKITCPNELQKVVDNYKSTRIVSK